MNILVTLNSNYVKQLITMIKSLLHTNPEADFKIYIANKAMTDDDFLIINSSIGTGRYSYEIIDIKISDTFISDAPISGRYPLEMYYRIFAAKFLPGHLDRILYLDPDIVCLNPIDNLYNIDFGDNYFAAASHVHEQFQKLNELRLKLPEKSSYINSGVMMINLELLRKEQNIREVLDYINDNKSLLLLPDQDVINAVYHSRIISIEPLLYNLNEKYYKLYNLNPKNRKQKISLDWIISNTVFIHYCGRNKPWGKAYFGEFDSFYKKYEEMVL